VSSPPSGKLVATSVGWSSVQIVVEQISLFGIFVVLARLLDPATFGVVALAVIFVEVAKVIASNGLSSAVVQINALSESAADTAFWINMLLSVALGALMALLSSPLAKLLHQPQMGAALQVLAIVPAITAAGAIHAARNIRGFGYRALALRTLAANILGGSVAITLAATGHGIWALVFQRLVAESVLTVASWLIYPWVPGRRIDIAENRAMLRTGWHVSLTNLVFQLGGRVNEIVLTFSLAYAAVGLIRISFRVLDLATQFSVRPFSTVALPTLARAADEPERMVRQFHQIQAACAILAMPVLFGLGAVADPLIPLVFGRQWHGVIPIMQILAFMAVPICLNQLATPLLTAVGRADVGFRIAVVQLGLGALLSVLAAPWGMVWVALAYVLRAYVTLPWVAFNLKRYCGIAPLSAFHSILPALIASLAMGEMVIAVDYFYLAQMLPFVRLGLKVCLGAGSYALFLLLIAHRSLPFYLQKLKSLRKGTAITSGVS
jgi:O-antigen/teichoic acid export membrane protein